MTLSLRRLCVASAALAFACVKRTPCDWTEGAHTCSMIPEEHTCACEGRIEAAREDDQPIACGHVQTVCVGTVTREDAPTSSNIAVGTAGGGAGVAAGTTARGSR